MHLTYFCKDAKMLSKHPIPLRLGELFSYKLLKENAFALILFSTLPDNSHLSLSLEQIILQCSHLKQIKNYF